jgi:hypothetical protein
MSTLEAQIRSWLDQEQLTISEGPGGLVVPLSDGEGTAGIDLSEQDRVRLTHSFAPDTLSALTAQPESSQRLGILLDSVTDNRPGLITTSIHNTTITLTITLHGDGTTKQEILTALSDLTKMRRLITNGITWTLLVLNQPTGAPAEPKTTEETPPIAGAVAPPPPPPAS